MQDDQKMTHKEAAEYLNISSPTLYNWRFRNFGPPFYRLTSKTIIYNKSDLDKFINDRKVVFKNDL